MKKITAALIGAGQRGMDIYGSYAVTHPDELEFVAVAEPDNVRRERFCSIHGISQDKSYNTWEDLLERPKMADAVLVCTQDRMHYEPVIKAIEKGYHVLCEKPMSNVAEECIKMGEAAEKHQRVLLICHVLRYTPFFSKIKELLDQGYIGDLMSIQHNENVGYWHFAHSFVRGNWRNSEESSPIILAKSCHDMDIMLWLAGADCKSISSFGSLTHFKGENAPEGAPYRCTDGCPVEDECPYYSPRLYLSENPTWIASVISNDSSPEARAQALREGPYGRCVYRCDNNVSDHQVVILEFENEVTAAFTLSAFTNDVSRTIKLMGTKGEIRGAVEKSEIEITNFRTGKKDVIKIDNPASGHSGGDEGLMADFVRLVRQDGKEQGKTSAQISVQSHLMALAAEKSRVENIKVMLKD